MILEEFDDNTEAVFNPWDLLPRIDGFPIVGVSCFADNLIDLMLSQFEHRIIAMRGTRKTPIYEIDYKGIKIALFISNIGAPACVGGFEDVVSMGLEALVLFGTCGVLDRSIDACSIIVPTIAIRDEGTSYHYAESADEITVNTSYKVEMLKILDQHHYCYTEGKVWTTDAAYRETLEKVARRKKQGAICVDMECSAVAAMAEFRNKKVFHFFYAADNLDAEKWDARSLSNDSHLDVKEKITLLSLEMAFNIHHLIENQTL